MVRRYVHDGLRYVTPFIGVETGKHILFSTTRDRTIGRSTFVEGWWAEGELARVLELIELDPSGACIVEVGANIGTTTVQAAAAGARVVAFEPEPTNFRLLLANVAVNRLTASVTCIEAACSDRAGSGRLAISSVNDGEHRLSDDGTVEVDVVTVDDSIEQLGLDPADVDLLWIDVEGHERSVLAGCRNLIEAAVPVYFEFWPHAVANKLDDLAELLASYRDLIDVPTGQRTTLRVAADAYQHGMTNLLALP